MIPEPERGGTRGETPAPNSDAGSVALKTWKEYPPPYQKWLLCDIAGVGGYREYPLHGFSLRASSAVEHGVSPLRTVGGCNGCVSLKIFLIVLVDAIRE